ncbi:MAG TPA: hypothetical protein VLL08_14140 [Kineosporiaceae bacterium]|nr:hypothetical protein [Kineosporiaceae bacterium]
MSRTSAPSRVPALRSRLGIAGTGLVLISTILPSTAVAHTTDAHSAIAHSTTAQAEPVALPTGFRPEGVTSGPGDTYYTGSLADGRIWTGDLSRGTGRQLLAGVTGRALRGMQWDPRSGLLWVVGQDDSTGIVLAVDARTGTLQQRIVVPDAVFLNDLVITRKALWITDSRVDRLTRVPLDRHGRPAGEQTQLPLTGAWPTPEAGNRANGIRTLPDGSLVLDHSTAGGLWQVDPETGVAAAIPVTGGPAGGPGITGGDGLERSGRILYVVRGSGQQEVSVLKLCRNAAGWTATWTDPLTSPALDVPSTATLVGRTLWAVNARFGVADPATASYAIIPLTVTAAEH